MPKDKFEENSFDIEAYLTETEKFTKRSFAEASEDPRTLSGWFEDRLIIGEAKLEIKKHMEGSLEIESATVTTIDPATNKEVQHYTTEPHEIERLKAVRDGKPIVEIIPPDDLFEDENDDLG